MRRLNHLKMPRDDANVVIECGWVGSFVKENQITWLVICQGDVLALFVTELSRRCAGNLFVRSLVHGVLRQTAAVETNGVGA